MPYGHYERERAKGVQESNKGPTRWEPLIFGRVHKTKEILAPDPRCRARGGPRGPPPTNPTN